MAEDIQQEPELGYKEHKTTEKVINKLEGLGLEVEKDIAITGALSEIGNIDDPEKEPKIAVLGELDALINPDHPKANPETGAVHACGHNAQIANLIGVSYAFSQTNVIDDLLGALKIIAVPAEEYLDLEYRKNLMEKGKIDFFGGKQELIRRGYLDDVSMAMMMHASGSTPDREITSNFTSNGFMGKFITYTGKTAHAGAHPEKGVNALNAATVGLTGIHTQRETFKDDNHVRVHPIITKGGEGVNNVPSEVTLESYVRASTLESIKNANKKVNSALKGGAMSTGANIEINDFPGYLPLNSNQKMVEIYNKNTERVIGEKGIVKEKPHISGSTDMGDITQIIPGIHPWTGGFKGDLHSSDFKVVDKEMAYIIPAKIFVRTIIDILSDKKAINAIFEDLKEKKSKDKYLNDIRNMKNNIVKTYMK